MPPTPEAATSDPAANHRLVFLHGFTQTHHHWHTAAHQIGERLGGRPTLAFVDLPGHGLSRDDRSGIDVAGVELAAVAGTGTYVGYSMGGRAALVAATSGIVDRLVLIGATPGIDDEVERTERRRLDEERARRVEEAGVDAFVDDWLAAPMFATLPPDPVGARHRRRNSAAGLAHGLRAYGTGVQPSLWERLGEITIPVLVLAGTLDAKFTDVGRRMADALPDGHFEPIVGAGHAAHTERPIETAEVVAAWLLGQPSASPTAKSAP